MIEASIIADSISPADIRITTFVLTYPRFIHSELMTHRVFSRNAASSRAIPFERMVTMIENNVAMPVKWGSHQKGMQSGDEIEDTLGARLVWRGAMYDAIARAKRLNDMGVHKSITNRLLEPFAHMTTIVTATQWENFYSLRAHPEAQPEFQALAYTMLDCYLNHTPRELQSYEWHTPFGDNMPAHVSELGRLKIATARCARISYLNFEGEIEPEKDFALHDRLMQSGHWSPFEHCARAMRYPVMSGNFYGWTQYRKLFEKENRKVASLQKLLEER